MTSRHCCNHRHRLTFSLPSNAALNRPSPRTVHDLPVPQGEHVITLLFIEFLPTSTKLQRRHSKADEAEQGEQVNSSVVLIGSTEPPGGEIERKISAKPQEGEMSHFTNALQTPSICFLDLSMLIMILHCVISKFINLLLTLCVPAETTVVFQNSSICFFYSKKTPYITLKQVLHLKSKGA